MGNNRLVIFDVDGTLTREKSIWQYLMERTGHWKGEGEENLKKYLRGEFDFYEFCRLDATLFKSMKYSALKKIAYEVSKYDGLDNLFSYFTQKGYTICLLSTGLKLMTDYFTEHYNIELCFVNNIASKDDICTGEPIINVWEGQKGLTVDNIIMENKPDFIVAFGDSRGDIPVFEKANFSICINTEDEQVLAAATISFTGSDFTMLYPILEKNLG